MRGAVNLFVLPIVSTALFLTGCATRDEVIEPKGGSPPTGLLIVTLDTARADRIGSYGFRSAQTPNIDDLARRGVLFAEAVTPAPLTLPAHASLFTGFQPPHHGVRTNEDLLADEPNRTLAEILRERGFRTGAFIGAAVLQRWSGMDQGFATYSDEFPFNGSGFDTAIPDKRAEEVVSAAMEWLDAVGDDPFFLWVHLFDPHGPYRPPGEFARQFPDRPYYGEIAYSDQQIGVLLAALDRLGLRERTLVAFLSDHGEGLGEHDEVTHGFFLYDSTLRIPFILSYPPLLPQRQRIASLVEIVDVAPTALAVLGVDAGLETGGRNLLPLIRGERTEPTAAYAETHYPAATHGWSPLYSLRRDGFKVVRAPVPELYDLRADPAETHNLFDQRRDLGDEMLAELAALEKEISRDVPGSDPVLDAERRRALESLGYMVGAETDPDPSAELPDPKQRVATLAASRQARQLLAQRRPREAAELLLELERREPRSPAVIELLASSLLLSGQLADAEKAYERVLELSPRNDRALINLGMLAADAGDTDSAVAYLEQAYELNPEDPLVLLNLGLIRFRGRGERQAGRPLLERFLELAPGDPDADTVRELLAGEGG